MSLCVSYSVKLQQPAVNKMLKKHAACAHKICDEVPVELHAHQIRHGKATHWLEDGMNIVQISLWLGHEYLQTTMVYLDISNDKKAAALATLSDETSKKVTPKWKNAGGSLLNLYGLG
jgi:integrase